MDAISNERLSPTGHALADAFVFDAISPSFRNDYDDSIDYGIFQINSRYWCKAQGRPSNNVCGVRCEDLLTDSDIVKSAKCVKIVQKYHGISAWVVWNQHCSDGRAVEYARGC